MKSKITLLQVGISDVPQRKWKESSYRVNRIHVPLVGRARYRDGNGVKELNTGSLYLLINGFSQDFSTVPDHPYRHLYFDFQCVPPLQTHDVLEIPLSAEAYIQALLQAAELLIEPNQQKRTLPESVDKDSPVFPDLEQLLVLLLTYLQRKYGVDTVENGIIEDAIRFIEAHFDEPIQNDDIARALHIDKRYLIRLFTRQTSLPPYQYLTQYRVEQATDLLRRGMRVSDVAYRCGYRSETAFRLAFKRVTGLPPTAIRQSEKGKKDP